MDEWKDEWIDGCMKGGWMNEKTDVQVDKLMNESTGPLYRSENGQ